MDGNPQIQTNHQEGQIITDTYTCTQSQAFEKVTQGKLSSRTCRVISQQPDITGIEESRSIQVAENRETLFHIGFQFDITRLIHITILDILAGCITARAQRTDRKGTDAVGTSDIELFTIRSHALIAIRP